jgi:hypothetical protein
MSENTPILLFDISDNEYVNKIIDVYNSAFLPVGIKLGPKEERQHSLEQWWENRAVPVSRDGLTINA